MKTTLLFDTLKDNYDTLKGKWTVINPSAVLTFRLFIQGEQVYSIPETGKGYGYYSYKGRIGNGQLSVYSY